MRTFFLAAVLLITGAAAATASDEPAEFARLKALAGTWEQSTSGDAPGHRIEFAVTSAGNAVSERIFSGTDRDSEMTTMYFVHDGKVHLTHYCALGNRPEMALTASDATTLRFSLVDHGVDDPKAMHMHALTITQPDDDHLQETWTLYGDGEAKGASTFAFVRAKK